MNYIELSRIDLCYNQFFKSKSDALTYLEEQKKIYKKRTNLKSNIKSDYMTSVAYHLSNGSYFKIYHKGSEYINAKNGDFAKHQKINKEYIENMSKYSSSPLFEAHHKEVFEMFKKDTLGSLFNEPENKETRKLANSIFSDLPINTMFLRKEMDKVLRYEISITSKSLARIYKNTYFRRSCPIHKKHLKIYRAVKRYDSRKLKKSNFIPNKKHRFIYNQMSRFLNSGAFITLSRNKKFQKFCTSGTIDYNPKSDTYKISNLYERANKGTLLETRNAVVFTRSFLNELCNYFQTQINYYQIKELAPFDDLVKRVKDFNHKVTEKRKIYDELNEYKCFQSSTSTTLRGRLITEKKRKTKGNKIITKASQLLTETEKIKEGLKTIDITKIELIFRYMTSEKMTPSQIKTKLGLSKSAYYRRLSDLKLLGVSEQSMSLTVPIEVKTDFSEYYYNTSGVNYKKNFYLIPTDENNDYKKELNFY